MAKNNSVKKEKTGLHLVLLVILLILLVVVMIFSTISKTQAEYSFEDEITIDSWPDYYNQATVGEVKIKNSGILPARVYLKNYVLCQLSTEVTTRDYVLTYRGKVGTNYGDVFFDTYDYNRKFVDVSASDTAELKIGIMDMPVALIEPKSVDVNQTYNLERIPFYLFEVADEDLDLMYSYCQTRNAQDAEKVIYVNLDLPDDYLEKLKDAKVLLR